MQVQLQQIAVNLAGRPVLAGLDLHTRTNEYVVIVGPSGGGKTTTLRIIAGLQKPDRGEVRFAQLPVTTTPPRKRGVSMVFQHDAMYPHLTIDQSIRLGVDRRLRDDELQLRLKHAAEMTRIEGLLDRYPDQLSGGELRRAAIAKAIVRQAPVRLLDEPLSALDPSSRQMLQDDLMMWHREIPGTTIHVTHDGYEAMRLADRIAILHQGRIAQFDSPATIYHQPANLAAAQAIGSPSINLIPARIEQGRLVPRVEGVRIQVECEIVNEDRDVVIGVRPESLRVVGSQNPTQKEASARGIELSATLLDYRQAIHQPTVRAQLGEISIHGIAKGSDAASFPSIGSEIQMYVEPLQFHIFDAAHGQCLLSAGPVTGR